MKTYRIVFLFAALSAMASAAYAADVTTVVNAQISIGGSVMSDRGINGHLQVVAYVDGEQCGDWSTMEMAPNPEAVFIYYPVTFTIDESKVGKPIDMHVKVAERSADSDWSSGTPFYAVSSGEYVIQDVTLTPGDSELAVKDGAYGSADDLSFVVLNFVQPSVALPSTFTMHIGGSVDLLSLLTYSPENASVPYNPTITWDAENSADYITIEGNTLIAGEEESVEWGAWFSGTFDGYGFYVSSNAIIIDPDVCKVYASLFVDGTELTYENYEQYGLSAFVGENRLAGPTACEMSPAGGPGSFALKLKGAQDGDITFRVSRRSSNPDTGEESFSSSEYIIQSARLKTLYSDEDSITTFPFQAGTTYGSSYNPVRVELVTPSVVEVSPMEFSAAVGESVKFGEAFALTFLASDGSAASVPSGYDVTWNVGNYDVFSVEGDVLTVNQYSEGTLYVGASISNDELGLGLRVSRIAYHIIAPLTGMYFASDYQELDRGVRVSTQLNAVPAQATIAQVRWVFDSNAFEFRDDDAGGPQVLWVKDAAPYGDYEIVAAALDENGRDLEPLISDTLTVVLCTGVTGIESSVAGLMMTVGQTVTLSSYIKVLPEEACNKDFIIEGITGERILEEGEDEEGRLAITAVELGTATLTITAEAGQKEGISTTLSVTVATPLESIRFAQPEQSLHRGANVNTDLTIVPDNATGYEILFDYDETAFDMERPATGGPATYRVKADAPYGDYEIVALANDVYGNDLHISDTLTVTVCAAVTEIQVVSPVTMSLGEERAISSLVTAILPEEACEKGYRPSVSGNDEVIAIGEDNQGNLVVRAVGYGSATLTVTSNDRPLDNNPTVSATIDITVADVLTSISFANRNQFGYPGETVDLTWTFAPEHAIAPEVQWEYNEEVFALEASPAGAPTMTIKEGAAAGEYDVVAKAYNGDTYLNISDTIHVAVWAHVTDITVTSPLNMIVGDELDLTPYIIIVPANAHEKRYRVSSVNTDIVSVGEVRDEQGNITSYKATALAEGSATLTVVSTDNQSITKEITVNVAAATIALENVAAVHAEQTVEVGQSVDLSCTFTPQDATDQAMTWTTNNNDVVTVSQNATNAAWSAEAVAPGTAVLTGTSSDGGHTTTITVTVPFHVTEIQLTASSITVNPDSIFNPDVYVQAVLPEEAANKDLVWTTSDESVVKVEGQTGSFLATSLALGDATLTATSLDNREVTASLLVHVVKAEIPLTGLAFVNPAQERWGGETVDLSWTPTPADATSYEVKIEDFDQNVFEYTQGDAAVGQVMRVKADARAGEYTVKAVAYGADGAALNVSATLTVTVKRHVERIETIPQEGLTLTVGQSSTLSNNIKVLPEDAFNKKYVVRSNNPEVASVTEDADGGFKVEAKSVGSTTLTVISNENTQITGTLAVTVVAAEIPLTGLAFVNPAQELWTGETVDLSWTPTPADATSYEVKIEGYDQNVFEYTQGDATVGQVMTVKADAAAGEYTVKAVAYGADGAALNVSATLTVTVKKHVKSLSLTEQTLSLTKGESTVLDVYVKISPDDATNKAVTWTTSDESVATLAENNGAWTVTAVAGGEVELTVASVDNAQASAKMTLKVTVPVAGITINDEYASRTLWLGVDELSLKAEMYTITPSDASNQNVTWASADESVVSVVRDATSNNSWKAVPQKVGRTSLTVTTEDGQKSAAMNVEVKRHVDSFSLTVNALTLDKGSTQQLDELVKEVLPSDASDKRITWRLDNNATGLTITENDGKWYVTANAVGEYTLVASSADNPQLMQRLSVTVNAVVGGISVKTPVQSVYPGGVIDLSYTIDSNDESIKVVWSSSDANVVSVGQGNDGQWTATALKSGSATLTVKTVPGDKTATITVTVWSHVESLSLTEQTLTLTKGQKATLDGYVKITPDDAHDKAVTWTTSDESVATVSENNGAWTVTAVAGGEAVLKVVSADNAQATAAMTVKVTVPLEGIVASKPSQTVEAGGAVDLSLTYSPSDATGKDVTWTTSDANVVTVSRQEADGVWTAKAAAPGTAVLTAKSSEGGHTTTITVTVPYHVTKIQLTQQTITLYPGDTFNPDSYVQSVEPSEARDKTLTWTSSDGSVVSIEGTVGSYTATVKSTGTAVLTATSNDNRNVTAALTVTSVTKVIPVTAVSLTEQTLTLTKGESTVLDVYVKISPDDATNKAVTWTTSDESVATLAENNGAWTVTAVAGGEVELTVASVDNAQASAKMTLKVTVPLTGLSFVKPVQELWAGDVVDITWTPTPQDANSYKVEIEGYDQNVFEYTSGNAPSMKVRANAPAGEYTMKAVAYNTDGKTLNISAELKVTVKVHVSGLSISDEYTNKPLTLLKGTSVSLDDLVTVSPVTAYDKKLTWTSSDENIAMVTEKDGSWSVTGISAGETTLKVTSADNPTLSAELKVTVTVAVTGITIKSEYAKQTIWLGADPLALTKEMYAIAPSDATNATVAWSSSDESVVAVSQNATTGAWVATPKKVGSATLTVKTLEGGFTATMAVEVKAHVTSFKLTAQTLTLDKGDAATLDDYIGEVLPADASDKRIAWRTTEGEKGVSVAQHDGKWIVTANAVGEYTLTAYSVDNPQMTQTLKVSVSAVAGGISVTSPIQSVYPGGVLDMSYAIDTDDPSSFSVTWISSNADVVSVTKGNDGQWTATALKSGTATLTVKTTPGDKTATIRVTVWSHVDALSLTEQTLAMTKGQSAVLDKMVTITPADAHDKTVTWTSSNPSVASVAYADGSWSVKALAGGEAVLTVVSEDNPKAVAQLAVTVTVPLEGITAVSPRQTVEVNASVDLALMFSPSDASRQTVTWTSSEPTVVAVEKSAEGVWTAVAKASGSSLLTAKSDDGGHTATVMVTVPYHVTRILLSAQQIVRTPGAVFNPDDFVQAVEPKEVVDKSLTWTSSDPSVVKIEGQPGAYTATALAVGTVTLTATSVDNPTVKATLAVTVEAAVGGISVANPVQALYPGGAIDLSYTINSEDASSVNVEWKSDNPGVVEVKKSSDGTWTANALKSGKAVLTVTTVPGNKTATITVTVWSHVDALSLTQQTLTLTKGTSSALNGYVKITPDDAHDKAVRWTSSDPSIASVTETDGTWTVTALAGGDAVLTATSVDNPKAVAKMSLKVTVPLEGLSFNHPQQTVFAGESVDVAWTPTPLDALSYDVKLEYDQNVFMLSTTVQNTLVVNAQASAGEYTVKAVAYGKEGTPLGVTAELKVTVKKHVEKIEVSLTGVLTLAVGDVVALADYIKVMPEDAADKGYSVQSANPQIVSVTGDAQSGYRATAVAAGETTLEIVSTDNPAVKVSISIRVAAEVVKLESLSFNNPVQSVYAGEQVDGSWTATPADAANYIVNLEFNQDVFTILPSAQNKLKVNENAKAGDYVITAKAYGLDGKELDITAALKVTVRKHVTAITLAEQTLTMKKGSSMKMDDLVKFTPEDADDKRLQWTSSDEAVVSLSETGGSWTATALAGGTVTLTAASLDNPQAKAQMKVEVNVPLEGVVADHPQQTVEVGSNVDLSCTFTPADATDTQIRWSSSDESVVEVAEGSDGKWTAVAKASGNTVLTGRTHEGGYVATISVAVPYHVTGITLTAASLSLKPGDTFNPDSYVQAVVPEQAADKSLTWTSSDESVVKIEGKPGAYTATAVGVGEVTLTVRSNDRPDVTQTLQVSVTEEVVPLTGLAFAVPSQTVFAGDVVDVAWTPTPASATSYNVKLKYDEAVFELKSDVMTVRPDVAAGDYQIVAQAYDSDGGEMNVRALLTVTVRTHVSGIVLSDELGDEPLSVTKDETVVLDGYVTVTPADAYNQRVVWTSSDTSVATVAEKDGVWSVTGVSLGEATLTVTSADNPYVSARVSIVVVAGVIPVTGFDMADAVSMTKDSGTEVIKLTPIPADATVDVSKFSVAVSDIYGQGKDWRYLDVNVREQDGQYEAVINAAYVWGINAFDVLYDGKKMGSVSVNVGADLSFAKGWNWISTPYADYAAAGLAKVELDDMGKTFGDALQEVRSSDALLYNDPDMGYFGDFSGLTSAKMYQFHFNADPTNNLVLYNINRYDGGSASINAGWTWLAYPYEYAYTPAELAKAGVFDAAVEGDRIVAQDGFAEFSDGKWSGTLTRLQPTAGLMYFRNAEGRSAVAWKGYDALGQKLPAQDGGQAGANGRRDGRRVWDYDARAFADNMTVVAAFDGIDFPENCTVGAFVDGECRGQGQYADGRYFITVHGAAGESVSFVLYDEQSGDYWTVQGSLSFSDKAGSIKTPLRLKVGERTTAIPNLQMADSDASERTIHDLQGRRVLNPEKGVYIIQGEKKIIK